MVKMPQKKIELYKSELIIVAFACLLSIALLVMSVDVNKAARHELEQLVFKKDAQVNKINNLMATQQMLKDIGSKFEALKSNGFYGSEDRLPWAEALKDSSQRLKLPNLKYSISPQEKVEKLAISFLPSLMLSQSVMNIEADLLHEGDLLSLSEALSTQLGLYRVVGCELEKGDDISVNTIQKNVSLKCSLAWHTLKYDPAQNDAIEEDIDLGIE